MLYIHRNNGFWKINEALPDSYLVGENLGDYVKGAYLLLNTEQEKFKEDNPQADQMEAWNMKLNAPRELTPEEQLQEAREKKEEEILKLDADSERFYISTTKDGINVDTKELWLDKDLRNSLYSVTLPALESDQQSYVTLWTSQNVSEPIEVPIEWLKEKLQLLEIYAKKTYDCKSQNCNKVYKATSVEEIESIDIHEGYPKPLTFEYNLDLNK